MEKTKKTLSSLIFSRKTEEKEKVLFTLNSKSIAEAFLCFAFWFAKIFSSMSPFGVSFYSSCFKTEMWSLNYVVSLVGIVVARSESMWSYAGCLTLVTLLFAISEKLTSKTYIKASVVFISFLICEFMFDFSSSYTAYDVMSSLLEASLASSMVVVIDKGYGVISNIKGRSFITETENICIFAFLSLVFLCIQGFGITKEINVGKIIGITAILASSFKGDLASSVMLSVFSGAIFSLYGGENALSMGTYTFGALMGCAFKKFGRLGSALGFMIAIFVSSILFSDSPSAVIDVYDASYAFLLFLLLPQKTFSLFELIARKNNASLRGEDEKKLPDISLEKLKRIALNLSEIGEIYDGFSSRKSMGSLYTKMMAGNICSKVCTTCQNKESCWKEDGEATKTINEFSKNDFALITTLSLPMYLRKKCHRTDSFADSLKLNAERIKSEKQWLHKFNETRKLMGSQLKSISRTIDTECDAITKFRDTDLEKRIYTELDILKVKSTLVFAKSNGENFEAEISFEHSNVGKDTKRICIEAIEKATGTNVSFAGFSKSGAETIMKFSSPFTYTATFGYAVKVKTGEKMSGDSFNVIYPSSSKAVMALSDGMGSGEKANCESRLVIDMLKKFLLAGFSEKNAAELINSSLLLKSEKDSFATLDICSIDLKDASLSFTRLGASSAYIKSNEKVVKLKGTSLPLGVMKNQSGEKHMFPIDSDVTLVLMSDGVGDVSLKRPEFEGWIEKELESINSKNPQIVASKLLNTAVKISGKKIQDDMTVLVGCITKNEGIFY